MNNNTFTKKEHNLRLLSALLANFMHRD